MIILSVSHKKGRHGWTVYYLDEDGNLRTFVTKNWFLMLWYKSRRAKRQYLNNSEYE